MKNRPSLMLINQSKFLDELTPIWVALKEQQNCLDLNLTFSHHLDRDGRIQT